MLSKNICPLHTYMEECCKKFMSVLPNSTTVKLKLMNKHQNKVNSASLLYFHRTAQNILGFVYLYFLTFFLLKQTNGYLLNIAESTSEVSRTRLFFCFFVGEIQEVEFECSTRAFQGIPPQIVLV